MTAKNKKSKKSKKYNQPRKANPMMWIAPLILTIVVVVILIITNGGSTSDQLADTISVKDAADKIDTGTYLLDVREVSEWNEAHVEGAVLIPLGELQSRISEIPTDQDVLIICRSGNRSGQARDLLRAAGLMRTTSISGGINAWIAAGFPVVTGP